MAVIGALKAACHRYGLALLLFGSACEPAPLDVIGVAAPAASGGVSSQAGGGGEAARAGSGATVATGGAASVAPPLFDPPILIASLAEAGADDDPSVTRDLLELYFSSQRAGSEDIWVSKRSTPSSEWGEPVLVTELNSSFVDATPGIEPEGLTIWFESTRVTGDTDLDNTDIWVSSRASRSDSWSEPALVAELNTAGRDSAPLPSSPRLMTFSMRRAGGVGDTDIYVTVRASVTDPWGPASPLVEVSSPAWDQGLLRADGTQIFISSGREAALRSGNLFWSARTAFGANFFEPVPLLDLNSDDDDQDLWVSESLDYVVFASSRSGDLELYEAHGQH